MRRIRLHSLDLACLIWIAGFCLCLLVSACHQKTSQNRGTSPTPAPNWNQERAQAEYQLLQAESQLAKAENLYLVIDLTDKLFQFKLKGVVVWDYPIDYFGNDSQNVDRFYQRFRASGQFIVRPITGKYLFAGRGRTADSLLAIIANVVNVNPELLQREVPERFQIQWGDGLILDVSTEVSGKAKSPLKNTLVGVGQALARPFGEARLSVTMDTTRAITFYRAAETGLPTLVYPVEPFVIPAEKRNPTKQ